ncbi:MAG: S-layer homology domain-containing protein [Thermodesulfobacteriota bacterium]|nr:S-layer homology domain-containing protein [Thermodesulfobacteriota bacterium]
MTLKNSFYVMAVFSLLFVFACGPKAVAPEAQLDTPEHHVTNGNKFLKAGRLDDALNEFTRAKQLDPRFSPAYTGLGLVYGEKEDFKQAFEAMEKAGKYAGNDMEKAAAYTGYIQLYTMGGEKVDKDWLDEAEKYFEKASMFSPDKAAPYYYMGIAYKNAYKFSEAADKFKKVLALDKQFIGEADREYAIMQRIERAMPGTKVGKKIALLDSITRGDVAALFIEELKVDELFKKKAPKKFDTSFKSPEKEFKTGEYVKAKAATDIEDHVLRHDIQAVMDLQIKGLQPYPDHTFRPYEKITRAEFAMMIEDILIKITGDEALATKFIGNQSPFPDLRNDLPYFNAAMVCVTRNIMETVDTATGEFKPHGLVSGADALLSIRQLKIQLDRL